MKPLNKNFAPKSVMPEKVIQFGEGNFLRAFVDWIIWNMNQKTDFNGSVSRTAALAGQRYGNYDVDTVEKAVGRKLGRHHPPHIPAGSHISTILHLIYDGGRLCFRPEENKRRRFHDRHPSPEQPGHNIVLRTGMITGARQMKDTRRADKTLRSRQPGAAHGTRTGSDQVEQTGEKAYTHHSSGQSTQCLIISIVKPRPMAKRISFMFIS